MANYYSAEGYDRISYGIGGLYLGESCPDTALTVEDPVDSELWKGAVCVETFYRAGGIQTESPTSCRIIARPEYVQVRVDCAECAPRVSRPSNENHGKLEWMARGDRVELALAGGTFGRRDYAVFTAASDGTSRGRTEKGMTYYGGDHAIIQDDYSEKNNAVVTELRNSEYKVEIAAEENAWHVLFTIPWGLFGGKPEKSFRIQVYRKKNQTSEVLAMTPLDLNENYDSRFDFDPETFIDCYLRGGPRIDYATSACIVLPDGIMHWQRPALLAWPTAADRKDILALQRSSQATTMETIPDRIVTVQHWQDTLVLEGMDFFPNSRCENSFDKVDPWVQRRLCNEALRSGDFERACTSLDTLIDYFKTLTSWWYADHTLGDAEENRWNGFTRLTEIKKEDSGLMLRFSFGTGARIARLCPLKHGMRFTAGQEGTFGEKSAPFLLEEAAPGTFVAHTEESCITIHMGADWSVDLDGRFVIDQKNFQLYEFAGESAFDIRQPLREKEMITGFGERFDAVNQRGHVLSLWHRDAFEGCNCSIGNQAYKNVSLMHSTAGYSLFINSYYRIRADIGVTGDDVRITTAGPEADFYVWTGTAEENMDAYTALTGRPVLPPDWVFEPWAGGGEGRWRNGPTHDVIKEMEGVVLRFKNLDIPHSGLYAEGAGWRFPDHYNKEEVYQIADFTKAQGMRVFSWQFSLMSENEEAEFLPDCPREQLPITRTPEFKVKRPLPSAIDFSNPRAKELLEAQWHDRMDAGFSGTMVDFGEIIPEEAVFSDGRTGAEMHNAYAVDYTRAYRELFLRHRGEDHVLFSRTAAAGTQKYACQFGGDQLSSMRGLTFAISGGISAAMSGLPFWGVDIGGYTGFPDEETYLRWTEFGAFCPIMRYHGTTPREPWVYSEYATEVYKFYAWLRENILPYSVETALHTHDTGAPVMRAISMEFPGDAEAAKWTDEYLYGEYLLVAPVHTEGEKRAVYFPEGRWTNLFDNTVTDGKNIRTISVPIGRIPVYLREGSVIPLALNGDMRLGESMRFERRNVLMLTEPSDITSGVCRSGGKETKYILRRSGKSFAIHLEAVHCPEWIVIMGMADEILKISENGKELSEQPSLNALRFCSGWVRERRGEIILRVLPSELEEIVIMEENH